MTARTKIGLDIGSFNIKLLEVTDSSGKLSLVNAAMRKVSGTSKESISNSIKAVISENKVSSKDAAISVSGSSVLVRFISVPKMREEELEGAVRFEAEKLIPFNINECVLDHQILRRNDKEGKIDLMLVAAKKEYIESRVSAVEDAGLLVSLIDVDACAIANSFMRNFQSPDKEKTFALLNIGAAHTNLNIIKDGVTHFVRDIGVGGADFTAAISQALAVDIDDAEMMKTSAGEKTAPAGEQLKNVFNNLIEEVRLSFGYYENQYGKAIDTVYISGGSIVMPGMEDVFQEAFGSKPLTWDPLSFLEVSGFKGRDLQGLTRHFGVASGLVLR